MKKKGSEEKYEMKNERLLRQFGKTDLILTPIGLGCWQFSRGKGFSGKYWPILQDEEILNIVRISLEGGINWFDTAESYGRGESERALAWALKSLGKPADEVTIATKWFPVLRRAKNILNTIDRRREALADYPITLYQIHHPLSFSSRKAEMKAMAKLVETGKIRFVGVSNFSANQMREAHSELLKHGIQLASNQVWYNLLRRRIETNGILETARELGVAIIAFSPLAQGILTGKFHDQPGLIKHRPGYRKHLPSFKPGGLEKSRPVIETLRRLSQKYQATSAQVALNWLVNFQGDMVFAIPGATSAAQARDNVGCLKFRLTQDELDELEVVSAPFRN